MARELYALFTPHSFCLPTNPGPSAIYVRPNNPNNPQVVPDPAVPLSRTKQATIDTTFARRKHYYTSMVNIKRACFMAVDGCINDAYKVSNDPTIQGLHAGMSAMSRGCIHKKISGLEQKGKKVPCVFSKIGVRGPKTSPQRVLAYIGLTT